MSGVKISISETIRAVMSKSDKEQLDGWIAEVEKKVLKDLDQVTSDLVLYGCYVQQTKVVDGEIVRKVVPYEEVMDV